MADYEINKRLKKIIYDVFNSNVFAFSKAYKDNRGVKTSQVINNRNGLSSKLLDDICNAYPNINKNWILTGEGEMLKSSNNENNEIEIQPNTTYLPLIPIDAMAGFKTSDNEGVTYFDCEQYAIPEFTSKGADFLIRVSGSSMYPKYSNGDILACKKIDEILFFQWGKIYVIDSSQGALVKRIYEDKENKDNILCVSDNKENYPPFSIPKSDIRSLSIVIGAIRID